MRSLNVKGTDVLKYSLVFGGVAGAVVIAIATAGIALGLPSHLQSAWFGYLVMLAALSLIFVGVKRFRDVECGGVIKFGRAFALGLGVALAAAAVYVAGWEFYLAASGHDFMAQYAAGVLRRMVEQGATPAVVQAKAAEMRELATRYESPLFRVPMTFVEIFPVGLIVALVSAGLLRNPRFLAERAR